MRSFTLVSGVFFFCVLACVVAPRRLVLAQGAPPATYYYAPYVPSFEEEERARRLAANAAKRVEREQSRLAAQSLTAQHRAEHRVFAYLGFAPVMVVRTYSNENAHGRFRQRAFTLGGAYRHHFRPRLGLHVGGSVGVGRSYIGLALQPGSECCSPVSKRVAVSYSLETEVAPLFGPFGGSFYFAPAWVTRAIIAPENSASIAASDVSGDPAVRTVYFQSPIVTTGGRLTFGIMMGRHHEYDLNFGLEAGYAARDAHHYLGTFARFGVAFGDLARR